MSMGKYILDPDDFFSEIRSGDRVAGPSTRSAGIKEALSVSVPDSSTSRISVSPACQNWGVLANSQARMAVGKGGGLRAASMGVVAGDSSSGKDCAP
jgi:hypothetical protein